MKKILVPTDFSVCAQRATEMALWLARKTASEIHFLHIESVPQDWTRLAEKDGSLYPEITKKVEGTQRKLTALVEKAQKQKTEAKKFLVYNKSYQAILDHIDGYVIDLVVMGSQGSSGLKEFIVGSNTQKIVRLSPKPVMVIKEKLPREASVKRIAFVSDFQEEVMEQFKMLVALARTWEARLYLVFINTPANFTDTLTTKIKMGNYAMHAPGMVENTFIFNDFNFQEGLQKFCKEHAIDLVSMITHGGRSGWQLFNDSLTEKMVNHMDLPLLAMHFHTSDS